MSPTSLPCGRVPDRHVSAPSPDNGCGQQLPFALEFCRTSAVECPFGSAVSAW
jgi:hypothetical protein